MQNLQQVAVDSQVLPAQENSDEIHAKRKVGVEIVRSAELSSRFFKSWGAASYSLGDDLWSRRLEEVRAAG